MKFILASAANKSREKLAPILNELSIEKILCIPTAANVYPFDQRIWQQEEMQALQDLGIKLDVFDIEGKSLLDIQEKLAAHTAIYVTGGNTYYLLEHMRRSGFDTAFQVWADGQKLYLGCSAGAVVACSRIDYIGALDDASKANLTEFSGLEFCPALVMPHADHPKYGPIIAEMQVMWQQKGYQVITLRDDQILFHNEQTMTVL